MNTVLFENKLAYAEDRKEWNSVHILLNEKEKSVARQRHTSPWTSCIDWCKERLGYERNYPVWVYNGDGWFEFGRKEDAVLFALRWA